MVDLTIKYIYQDPLTSKKCLKHGVNFVMSTLKSIIVMGETYKSQTRNIIVGMMSMNICPLWIKLFYINGHTDHKHHDIFVGMVTD